MTKEPDGRYQTAQELADDLRRFLEDKPIKAKRPTLRERAVKWSRRHPAILGTAFAILTVTVLALLVNSLLLRREQSRTAAALKLADARSGQARKAVDTMYTRVAEKWLVDQPGLRPLQREFLEEALAFYQEFAGQPGEDTEAQIEQAVALRRVGDIEDALSKHEQSERLYLQAIGLLDGIADDPPGYPRQRVELATVHVKLGLLYQMDERVAEAARHHSQALVIYRALRVQNPDRIEYQVGEAGCLLNLGNAHANSSEDAEQLYSRARQLYESLVTRPETRVQATRGLMRVYHNLADRHAGARRFLESERDWRNAVKFSAQALADSPTSPRYKHEHAGNLEGLAMALASQEKWLEAERVRREVIRIREPLAIALPETSAFREGLAQSLCNLGDVLHHLDQSAEEEAVLRRSIEISNGLINEAPRRIHRRAIMAGALINLADCERKKGHIDASKALLADARSHIRIGLKINPRDPGLNYLNAEIESRTKGTDPPKVGGAPVSSPTDHTRSGGKKEEKTSQRSSP